MKLHALLTAIIVGVNFLLPASAAPVVYDVLFDGSRVGPAGTGTLVYDSDTRVLSEFSWDFGAEGHGAATTFLLRVGSFTLGGTPRTPFLWDILSHTGDCESIVGPDGIGCDLVFRLDPALGAVVPSTNMTGDAQFLSFAAGLPTSYGFGPFGDPIVAGYVSLREAAAAAEPSTALLALIGLIAIFGRSFGRKSSMEYQQPNSCASLSAVI